MGDLKLSENALRVLESRYLAKDERGEIMETPEELFRRVARHIASAERAFGADEARVREVEERFHELMTSLDFLPTPPPWGNAGRRLAQLSACYVLPVPDSLEGIFDAIRAQAMVPQSGGGTGFAFSRLRPEGSIVGSTAGVASGPVSFMKIFDAATEQIKQGGARRGANMAILRVDHPDIEKFITAKADMVSLTNFNISVGVTEAFLEAVREDREYDLIDPRTGEPVRRERARRIFDLMVENTWKNGDPGMVFLDRMNNSRSNPVPSYGPIESTNPSMPAGTLVGTSDGIVPIESLEGKTFFVKALDGQWAPAECFLSGEDEAIYEIDFGCGRVTYATKEHRWPVLDISGGRRPWASGDAVLVKRATAELWVGDYIPLHRNEHAGVAGDPTLTKEDGFFCGFLFGDDWITRRRDSESYTLGIFVGQKKQELASRILDYVNTRKQMASTLRPTKGSSQIQITDQRFIGWVVDRFGFPLDKAHLPTKLWTSNDDFIAGFVDGLFAADAYVDERGKASRMVLVTSRAEVAREVQQLLSFYGVSASVRGTSTAMARFPNRKDYSRSYERYDVRIGKAACRKAGALPLSYSRI